MNLINHKSQQSKRLKNTIYKKNSQLKPRKIFYKFKWRTLKVITKFHTFRAPGWLSLVSVWLWLRSWSHSSWVQVPHWALCWQLRALSLLWILCFPLSLPLLPSCSVSVSVSLPKIINSKNLKRKTKIPYFQKSKIEIRKL